MLANGGWDLTLILLTWAIWRAPTNASKWRIDLTLILLTWTIWRAPTNASKWRMGFNSAFKGLTSSETAKLCIWRCRSTLVKVVTSCHSARRHILEDSESSNKMHWPQENPSRRRIISTELFSMWYLEFRWCAVNSLQFFNVVRSSSKVS